MNRLDIMAGIDLGTTSIKLLVCKENANGSVDVMGALTSPSAGIKKGVIIDLKQIVSALTEIKAEAENMVDAKLNLINVGIAGSHIRLVQSSGVVAVDGDEQEITENDVERVLQIARVVSLSQNEEIVDVIPEGFTVDGLDGILNPVGMYGVRLGVESLVITGSVTPLNNIIRSLEMAPYEVNTPVRGEHITNDLAVGLKTKFQVAEKLKIEQGFALAELASDEKNQYLNVPCVWHLLNIPVWKAPFMRLPLE